MTPALPCIVGLRRSPGHGESSEQLCLCSERARLSEIEGAVLRPVSPELSWTRPAPPPPAQRLGAVPGAARMGFVMESRPSASPLSTWGLEIQTQPVVTEA